MRLDDCRHHSRAKDQCFRFKLPKNGADISERIAAAHTEHTEEHEAWRQGQQRRGRSTDGIGRPMQRGGAERGTERAEQKESSPQQVFRTWEPKVVPFP